jgi:hypothetical protein
MSMKNPNDTIGNRNRALPVCTAVPQPTAPPLPRHETEPNANAFVHRGVYISNSTLRVVLHIYTSHFTVEYVVPCWIANLCAYCKIKSNCPCALLSTTPRRSSGGTVPRILKLQLHTELSSELYVAAASASVHSMGCWLEPTGFCPCRDLNPNFSDRDRSLVTTLSYPVTLTAA